METLEPIKTIPVSFGKPYDFSPPSVSKFKDSLFELVKGWVAHKDDAITEEYNLWYDSLTGEQKEKVQTIETGREAARELFDRNAENDDSADGWLCRDFNYAFSKFKDSIGKHLCLACSSFCDGPAFRDGMPYCDNNHCNLFVLPYCRACEHFSTGVTKEMMEINEKMEKMKRLNPKQYKRLELWLELDFVRGFVKTLNEYPSQAFYRVKLQPEYYFNLYEKFSAEFAKTKYPTLEEFKAGFNEWDEDCQIREEEGGITLSISKDKFAPAHTDTLLPVIAKELPSAQPPKLKHLLGVK